MKTYVSLIRVRDSFGPIILSLGVFAPFSVSESWGDVTGIFQGVSFWATDGGRHIQASGGSGVLKNESDEIVADGKLTDAAGLLVIAGKKNASFSHKASSKPFEEVAWSKEAPKDFATVEFSEGGRWTLRDDKFLFVLEIAVLNRSKIVPALDKSLARASVITLPKGTYTLWGYTVTVEKSKGTLIFAHGKLVDTSDVASKTIPPAPTAPQGQPPVDADKYEPADPSELSFSIKDMNYRTGPDGETPTSGNVGHFICEGHELQLAKQEFEDGFIVTKDYGKIKIRFSRSLFSSGFSVWLTAKQKEALKPLKDTIKK